MTAVGCGARVEAVAGTFAAAQQDMEFHSRLAMARHHLENLLAGLSATVTDADPEGRSASFGEPQNTTACAVSCRQMRLC